MGCFDWGELKAVVNLQDNVLQGRVLRKGNTHLYESEARGESSKRERVRQGDNRASVYTSRQFLIT